MTSRPRRNVLPLVLLLALLPGCAFFKAIAGAAFDPPKLTFESWSAQGLDLDGVTVLLKYRVDNPNSRGFKLSKVAWALDLEGKPAAKGDMPAGLTVPAKGSAPLEVPVRVRWRELPDVAALFVKDEVGFKIQGNAALASAIGDIDLPFSREGRVKVPRPPGFALEGVRIKDLSFTNLSLDVKLKLTNANAFPLPVGALAWGLRLGGEDVGAATGHPLTAVPPNGAATVTIPIRVSTLAAGAALRKLLGGAELPLEMDGKAEFGGLTFPFDLEGRVDGDAAPQSKGPATRSPRN